MIQPVGYLKLWRELFTKPIWLESTPEQKTILITLLAMANFSNKEWEWKGKSYKAKRGQFVTSLDSIAKNAGTGISVQNVRTALKRFEKYEFLTSQSTNRNRLITIVNWELYQQNDNELTSNLTSSQQAANKQLTTREEGKEGKKVKNIYSDFTSNSDLIQALMDFEKMRNSLKNGKMTDRARKMMLTELNKLADTDEKKIAILEQSIYNNWKGVFPLKQDKQPQKQSNKPTFSNFSQREYDAKDLEEKLKQNTGDVTDEEFERVRAEYRRLKQ